MAKDLMRSFLALPACWQARQDEGSNIRKNTPTPQIFIISTGPNKWDIPRDNELQSLDGKLYRTDVHGTIILESDGLSVSVKTLKQK